MLLLAFAVAWEVCSRPTRVALKDGRTLIIDKVSRGPDHISYAPFTFPRLWFVVSRRLLFWPNTTYHGEDGSVGVFHHSEPMQAAHSDNLYLADRDGWWWEPTQQGQSLENTRLTVFPPMNLPPSPRFEVWTYGVRTGGGVLNSGPRENPTPRKRELTRFPVRHEKGPTLVVVHGVDVKTVDNVRPSEAEVHLQLERFRDGQPVRMKFEQLLVTNGERRGNQRTPAADGRFRTTLSPHAPHWTIRLSVTQDPPDEADPEAPIEIDLVIRPKISGTVADALKPPEASPK